MITGADARKRYTLYRQGSSKLGRMTLYINTQMDTILSRANRGFDMRKFLTDPAEHLCPVLGYAAAFLLGLKDVAEYLESEAKEYSRLHPEVLEVLKTNYPRVPCPTS